MKFIDLFCGIGGFHCALKDSLGAECVFASDIDASCRQTYKNNWGIEPHGDITKHRKDVPKHDILCAGFPCQPFSKAGLQRGFDDDRGNLFFEICKIANKHKPKFMILENVRNLASHDDGNTWNVIRESIDYLGYYTYDKPVILNTMHFNVPQNRERVVIMCKRKDLGELPPLPEISKRPKVDNLSEYITHGGKPNLSKKMLEVEKVWDEFIALGIEIPKFPIWTDWWDREGTDERYTRWIENNKKFYIENRSVLDPWLKRSRENPHWVGAVRKLEWQAGDRRDGDSMKSLLWSSRGSGIRVKRLDYIPTLVAMSHIPVWGPESRTLSSRELLRLQSFPEEFQYDEKSVFKQVGNAVNVEMIKGCTRFLVLNKPLF